MEQPITDKDAGERITAKLMECVELLGNFPRAQIDPRAWSCLLTYVPAAQASKQQREEVMRLADQYSRCSGRDMPANRAALVAYLAAVLPDPAKLVETDKLMEVQEKDLAAIEKWAAERSRNAAFFPADAAYLANVTLLLIREVRAAREQQTPPAAWLRCPSCGTHEISLMTACHNSACSEYGGESTVYEGWKKQPGVPNG